ncbi:MAG: choice-of-anchor J domain-containing protein [Acidobacteriota bacterium]
MPRLVSRLLLAAAAVLVSESVAGQPLTENFDSVAGLAGAGWAFVNNSNPAGTTVWFQGNTAAFASQGGAAGSYVAANLNGTTFGGNISNWLITPTLSNLQNGVVLTFHTRTETSAPAADRLEVRLSTNGSSTNVGATDASVGDFTTLLLTVNPALTVGGYPTAWTLFTVTLSGLPAGPSTGRIAFRHAVPNTAANADTIGLDTLSVTASCSLPAPTITAPATAGEGSPNRIASVPNQAGSTYAWTIANGTITAGQGTNQITFTAGTPGTLTLGVTETDGVGCASAPAGAAVNVVAAGNAVLFDAITPCRLIDTRNAAGPRGAPALLPAPSPDRLFAITGVCGVPSDAKAVSLNVTITNPQGSGSLVLYRGDGSPTVASSITFQPGATRANNNLTQLALDGSGVFKVQNTSPGTVDFIVDVNGYFR